jgi:L-ribulokinase
MQIYADVLSRPMLVAGSAQTPALGSAVAAAVTAGEAAGGHSSFEAAQQKMTRLAARRFDPDPAAARAYDTLYAIYRELHDSFGGVPGARPELPTLMKRLLAFRSQLSNPGHQA